QEEFGIYMDNMATETPASPAARSGAMEVPNRNIYQNHAPSGSLAPISPRNFRGSVQNNSRFDSPNSPRGTTLGGRDFKASPTAPSRFNRPRLN
ncbi:MAG: hypothetical protein JJ879_05460, partial [Sneathiella sp.]|nr:hypothetical protein [Sneathiella sp.]